jgi:hypothetical protein
MIRENRVNFNFKTKLEPLPAVGGDCSDGIQGGGSGSLGITDAGARKDQHVIFIFFFLPVGCKNLEYVGTCVVLDGRIVSV